MRCLFLDLASHDGLIALATEDEVVSSDAVHARIGDHELIPMLEELLRKAGWSYANLTHAACIVGPGGFTSLRVAVTCVNTLAHTLQIPSAGAHLSDWCLARADGQPYWLHSTKKDQLFVRGGEWQEPTLVPIEQMPQGDWCGELIEAHRALQPGKCVPLQPAEQVLPAFVGSQSFGEGILEPWYGRGW